MAPKHVLIYANIWYYKLPCSTHSSLESCFATTGSCISVFHQEYITPHECATPTYPAVSTEFQVDVIIIYDAMLLAPVIHSMCTGVSASHALLWNNLYRIRWALVHHRFRVHLIIRVQCALHHKNEVNVKFCRDSTHSRVSHSWGGGVIYSWFHVNALSFLLSISQGKTALVVVPELEERLSKFKRLEDFREYVSIVFSVNFNTAF